MKCSPLKFAALLVTLNLNPGFKFQVLWIKALRDTASTLKSRGMQYSQIVGFHVVKL
jgi:hypothetical protein